MSAVISYQAPDGVVILTDGATYDAEHRLTRIGRKVTLSDKVPLAIAARGNMHVGQMLTERIIGAVEAFGFDGGMLEIEAAIDQWREHLGGQHDLRSELLIAGISETHGPRQLVFHTWDRDGDGGDYPPFRLIHVENVHIAINGAYDISLSDMGLRRPHQWETPLEYFSTLGIDMLQFCRELELRSDEWPGAAHLIGGQLDFTVVTPKGVTVKTIHRWPDRIGEKIDPSKDRKVSHDRNIVPFPAGNRQQRRAAERAERKRA